MSPLEMEKKNQTKVSLTYNSSAKKSSQGISITPRVLLKTREKIVENKNIHELEIKESQKAKFSAKSERAADITKQHSFFLKDISDDSDFRECVLDSKIKEQDSESPNTAISNISTDIQTGTGMSEEKQPKTIKAPKALSSIHVERPSPVWPKKMQSALKPPKLLLSDGYVEPTDNFDISKVCNNVPDLSKLQTEEVYKADFTKIGEIGYTLKDKDDPTLLFESRFESGNLDIAERILGKDEYILTIRPDLSTRGHTQWFYFQVRNTRPNVTYRFHIVNLMKKNCLYAKGMRPLMFSSAKYSEKKTAWHRIGFDISYGRNLSEPAEDDDKSKRILNTLSFSFNIQNANDVVYFAHCFPYTYSDLQSYIHSLTHDPVRSKFFKHRVLGKSFGGNYIDMLSVTAKVESPELLRSRKAIIVSSRIHPGETNSSWMMKGFIEFILSDDPQAQYLRERFVIRVIPMLNPDGVIVGNHRCNLNGYDLNRHWLSNLAGAPEVLILKSMIARLIEEREIVLYCDLHGHNRKNGIFMYGCHNDNDEEKKYSERVFPFLLSQKAPDLFFFKKCQFKIQKSKEGTGRIALRQGFGILNSFTMEASFCGSDVGINKGFHFTTLHLEQMGQIFGRTLYDYFQGSPTSPNIPSSPLSSAAEPESTIPKQKYQLDIRNPIISQAFSNLKREIANGNIDFLESFGSSDSDTSSDEEELRIVPKKKTRRKSKASKSMQTIAPPSPPVKSPPTVREIKPPPPPPTRINSNKIKPAPKPTSIKKQVNPTPNDPPRQEVLDYSLKPIQIVNLELDISKE